MGAALALVTRTEGIGQAGPGVKEAGAGSKVSRQPAVGQHHTATHRAV